MSIGVRRGAALLLAALLTAGLVAVPAHAGAQPRPIGTACPVDRVSQALYPDVTGHVLRTEIHCVSDYGIARGRADGGYGPELPVLRKQMALFLWRLLDRAGVPRQASVGFGDVDGLDPELRAAVDTLAALGIAAGTAPGRFAPDLSVTRGQMASFLARTHAVVAGAPLPAGGDAFDDDATSGHADTIEAIAQAGIGVGVAERTFAPDRPVTRAQMAAFLARLLDLEVTSGRLAPAYDAAVAPAEPVPTEPAPTEPVPAEPAPAPSTPPIGYQPLSSSGQVCTVVGTEGDDVLTGTPGDDVLCGLGGDDVLRGNAGADVLDGGPGTDELSGELDDDDLDGGDGPDVLDGGLGENWCVPATEDLLRLCVYDLAPPTIAEMDVTPDVVEVDAADGQVTVRLHLRDDTGLREIGLQLSEGEADAVLHLGDARLVEGTVRDGWWELSGSIARFTPSAVVDLAVTVYDRIGQSAQATLPAALEVLSSDSDLELPQLREVSISVPALPVDVRLRPADVSAEVRLTDDRSGVEVVWLCVEAPTPIDYAPEDCTILDRVGGTALDGTYRGVVQIPAGGLTGDWNLSVSAGDAVHVVRQNHWLGPDAYDAYLRRGGRDATFMPLPDGAGRVPVLGTAADLTPPSVLEVITTPVSLDSLPGPVPVDVAVRALDEGRGVAHVFAALTRMDDMSSLVSEIVHAPTDGDRADGWWHVPLTVPQGLPPGVYQLRVQVSDGTSWRTYVGGASAGATLAPDELPLPGVGTITVVPHRSS